MTLYDNFLDNHILTKSSCSQFSKIIYEITSTLSFLFPIDCSLFHGLQLLFICITSLFFCIIWCLSSVILYISGIVNRCTLFLGRDGAGFQPENVEILSCLAINSDNFCPFSFLLLIIQRMISSKWVLVLRYFIHEGRRDWSGFHERYPHHV